MSKNRMVKTSFWTDEYITDLDPSEKLLFIYLFTNPQNNLSGIYKISQRRMAFDVGLDGYVVKNILERFERDEKIKIIDEYIAIKNNIKHQAYSNPKIIAGINREITENNPPTELIDFIEKPGGLIIQENKKPYREKIKPSKKKKILEKFNFQCVECGETNIETLEIDHIVALTNGGENNIENYQVLCKKCHKEKTKKDLEKKECDSLSHGGVKYSKVINNNNNNNNIKEKSFSTKVFDFWNSKEIIIHKKKPTQLDGKIKTLLKDLSEQEIINAIENYAKVLHSKKTYWSHKWTLVEFLGRQNGARVFAFKSENDYLASGIKQEKFVPASLQNTNDY